MNIIITGPASQSITLSTSGARGPRGASGPQGEQGEQGEVGPQGPSGDVLPGSIVIAAEASPPFPDEFELPTGPAPEQGKPVDNWNPSEWLTKTHHITSTTGFSGGRLASAATAPHLTHRIITNGSDFGPDGVLVLLHDTNRPVAAGNLPFYCPDDHDFMVAKNDGVHVVCLTEDIGNPGWYVIGGNARHMRVVTHALNLYPMGHMPALSGTTDAYDPVPVNAGNRTAPSGLGVAGSTLLARDFSHWVMSTVDTTGAVLTGIKYIGHVDADSAGWGQLWLWTNNGPGPITLRSQAAANSLYRIYCPGDIDFVLLPNAAVWLSPREQGGTQVVSQGTRPIQLIQDLTVQIESYASPVTPAALGGGGATIHNVNFWGVSVNGSGNAMPTSSLVRAQGTGGTVNITGFVGPGIATNKWPRIRIIDYAGTFVYVNDGGSLPGNKLWCPGYTSASQRFFGFTDWQYDPLNGYWILGGL